MSGRQLGPTSVQMLRLLSAAHQRGEQGLSRQAVLAHFRAEGQLGPAQGRGQTFDPKHTAYNLVHQGYIRRQNVDGRMGYAIERMGLKAVSLLDEADDQAAHPEPPTPPSPPPQRAQRSRDRAQPPISTHSTHRSRAVRYGAGTVQVPIAPRSVFDLGNVFTVTEGATS